MPFELFPLSSGGRSLTVVDFEVFAEHIRNAFFAAVPTVGTLEILMPQEAHAAAGDQENKQRETALQRASRSGIPEKTGPQTIVFPAPVAGADRPLVVASGLDPLALKKMSGDWLIDTAATIWSSLLAIKARHSDPLTGTYGATLFLGAAARMEARDDFHVVLVEAMAAARSPRDSLAQAKAIAGLLSAYDHRAFPLFHVGMGIFAYLISGRQRLILKSFCSSLISALKNKGCRRVHCGSSSLLLSRPDGTTQRERYRLPIDEAWRALHVACRRGPFAFCDYDVLINPGHFPLRSFSRGVLAKVQRRCRQLPTYSLLLFRPDKTDEQTAPWFQHVLTDEQPISAENGYMVVKPGFCAKTARSWAATVCERMLAADPQRGTVSVGISAFPEQGATTAAIVGNAQKALAHATLLGPASIVVFDNISLNVSGDVYFAEGDWAAAAREYRRGLLLAPTDVNLLNSLGVTYGMMNRTVEALKQFDQVLQVEPDNFMALYNRGLGSQSVGRHQEAVASFSSARAVFDAADDDAANVIDDLLFQLGFSQFCLGLYQSCIETFQSWHQRRPDSRSVDGCCRYIGIAYYRLEQLDQAVPWLQRALVYDEFDAESLSLLGELYLLQGEGDEIALRFCEKAVEIDERNTELVLRWGKVLAATGRYDEALKQVRHCTKARKTRVEAGHVLGTIYHRLGRRQQAWRYLKKVLNNPEAPEKLVAEARSLLN